MYASFIALLNLPAWFARRPAIEPWLTCLIALALPQPFQGTTDTRVQKYQWVSAITDALPEIADEAFKKLLLDLEVLPRETTYMFNMSVKHRFEDITFISSLSPQHIFRFGPCNVYPISTSS